MGTGGSKVWGTTHSFAYRDTVGPKYGIGCIVPFSVLRSFGDSFSDVEMRTFDSIGSGIVARDPDMFDVVPGFEVRQCL